MEIPAPRVNGQLLGQHLGRQVVLICDVSHAQPAGGPSVFSARSSDGVDLFLALPPGENPQGSAFVQVEGKVVKPNLVEVQRLQPVSVSFDAQQYNATLQLSLGKY
eukprot:gene10496-11627_t